MDFQYPSGEGLKANVLQMTGDHNNDAYRTLLSLGYSNEIVGEFNTSLRFSGRPSVDAFLEYRHEFMGVGKASMALSLIVFENRNALFGSGGNWYEHLFGRMNAPFDSFGENRLSVVTYNYDRSLETYLFEALKHSYGKSDVEVADVLAKIVKASSLQGTTREFDVLLEHELFDDGSVNGAGNPRLTERKIYVYRMARRLEARNVDTVVCLLKIPSVAETVAFRTGTGYRPRHVLDPLSSPPFSTQRQLPSARIAPA